MRKQVTALFADLVGSTAFGERVDPEAARAALTPYFEILRSAVEDHAGTVVKFTGDGVFAVFGLPEVAEDDARRAVAAGQDLQRRFGAFAATVRERHGVELGLRVGVNSGELVVGDDDEDLVGDVLNTAARLEAACSPGRVLVGEDTWRLTRSGVRYEVLGEISVKGKSEPIATFQVAELPDAAIEEHIPFVGRDAELADLLDAFGEARDSPVLRLVTVVGDPGVGKSRLASEVRGATSARSFDLRFERRGSTTFGPIADLLRLVTDGTADGVGRLLEKHDERDRLAPILASMLGHDAARSTEESFWGVRRLLEHLAEQHGPLLIIVDDIQWAEPLFWDLLDHLVEWTEAPVLVIALARPELRELRPELTQAGRRVAASIALHGLAADDTRLLAARLLDVDELPRELTDRIPASTEGNPLFVRELVNMLVDDGTLERDGDRWRLTIDADAIDVPPTIISLLASRVERLPDDERRAIELASVIGTDFDRGTLAAIASEDGSTGPLGVVLDRLRRRDLVEPSGTWSGDHPVYRFHHVLVRDAAYRRLLKQRRAMLHELVGRHVDEHHPGGDETDVIVAHHFEQVVRYRRDLGTVDAATDELARDAVERLRKAADSALAREDLPAAGSAAQRALELVGEDSAERDELLLVGCEALLSSGDVGAAEPLVSELADRSTDDRLAAWADCFRAQRWSLTDSDRLVEATDTADRAADALTSLGDAAGVAKARLVRAGCLARLGRVGECENELDLALGAARDAGDRRRTVAVLGAAPLAALWGPSPVSRAGGRCLDVLRLLRITTASPAVETTSIRCQAVLEALRGRLDSARDKLEQSRSTSQELGLRQGLFETELFAGFVELWAGEPGAAELHLQAAREGLGRLGIGADAGQAAALLARVLLDRGDIDAADALATEAFDSAGQNLQTAISSRSALAEVRAAQGRHDEATALAAEAVEIAGRTDIVLDHALAVEAAGRVARQAGDPGAAARAQSDARRLLADKGVTVDRGSDPDREPPSEPAAAERANERPEAVVRAGSSAAVSGPGRHRTGGLTDVVRPPTSPGESSGWDVIEASVRAWLDDDEVAWRRCYAADFIGAGRERLSPQRSDVGLDDWTTGSLDLRRRVTDVSITVERIAQRGDHWFVSRNVGTADGDEIGFVFVSQVVDGRIRRETVFDPSQLDEAIALADEGFDVENGLEDVGWLREIRQARYSVDPEVLERCFHRDFVRHDHRPLGWPALTRDDLIDAVRANPEPFVVRVPRVWRVSESGAVLRREEWTPDGASLLSGWIGVSEHRDRLVHRMDVYAEDDLDAALARYDEVTGSRVWRWSLDFYERMLAGDRDGYERTFTPDATFEERRASSPPFAGPIGVFIDQQVMSWVDVGLEGIESDVIEEDGEHRCLIGANVTTTAGDRTSILFLSELDAEGQGTRLVTFDHDQIVEALAELRSVAVDPNDAVGPLDARRQAVGLGRRAYVDRVSLAIAVGPADVFAECFAPDFVVVDRRAMGLGTRDLAAFIESNSALVGNVIAWTAETIETSDTAALTRVEVRSTVDESSWALLLLTERAGPGDDALITRWTQFDVDDRGAALETFQSLGAAHVGLPALTNTANEVAQRYLAARAAGDIDAVGGTLHPDFEYVESTASGRALDVPSADREQVLRGFTEFWAKFGAPRIVERDLFAVRGDSLVMTRGVETYGDDPMSYCGVAEVDDGLLRRTTVFDSDQPGEALDELDRRWVELGGSAELAEISQRWRDAMMQSVLDRADVPVSDDFVAVDHRPSSLGRRSLGEYLESIDSMVPAEEWHVVRYLDDRPPYHFAQERAVVGAERSTWDALKVCRRDGAELVEVHVFDLDQFDEAQAFFGLLTSTVGHPESPESAQPGEAAAEPPGTASTGPRELTNEANEIVVRFLDARDRGDDAAKEALLSPALELSRRQPGWGELGAGEVGLTEWKYEPKVGLEASVPQIVSREVIAIRGEQLVLARSVDSIDGNELPYLALAECRDGQIVALTQWSHDQLEEAAQELDRRWLERGGPVPLVGAMSRFGALSRSGDVAGVEAFVSPDLESVDHRALGMGVRGYREWVDSMTPLAGRCEFVMHEVLEHTDRIGLIRGTVSQADEGSWELLYLLRVDGDGRVDRYEIFEWSDVDAARTRFEEIATESSSDPVDAVTERILWLTNTADRLGRQMIDAQARCDVDEVDDLLHPDYVFDERSPAFAALGGRLETKAEYLDDLRQYIQRVGGDVQTTTDRSIVAIRGDDLCLSRGVMTRDGFEHPYLALVEVDEGRIRRVVFWDEAQFHDAVDELHRVWVERGGPSGWTGFDHRYRMAYSSGTVDDLAEIMAPGFVSIDARPLGLGERHRNELLASTAPLIGRVRFVVQSALVDGRILLGRILVVHQDDGSVVNDGLCVASWNEEWLQTGQELFGLDQWGDAWARFEELAGRSTTGGATAGGP